MRRLWTIPLLALLVLGATGSAKSIKHWASHGIKVDGVRLEYRRTITLEGALADQLQLESALGDIELHGVSGGLARLEVEIYEYEPNDLTVRLTESGRIRFESAGGHPGAVGQVRGEAPAGLDLDLETGLGDIELYDFAGGGEIAAESGLGDIQLQNAAEMGEVSLTTGKGDLRLGPARKLDSVELSTGMGGIKAREVEAKALDASTGMGGIHFLGCEFGQVSGSTGMGDISMQETRYEDADLSSGFGRVKKH